MSRQTATKTSEKRQTLHLAAPERKPMTPTESMYGPHRAAMTLQDAAGNRAASQLLRGKQPGDSIHGLTPASKLRVNEPQDSYEQEADRVADQVLAAPAHRTGGARLHTSSAL